MREDQDWRAAAFGLEIVLQPRELFSAKIAEIAGLEIDDVNPPDEVNAVVVKAVPARTLAALAVAIEIILAPRLVDNVVFVGNIVNLQPGRAERLIRGVVEFDQLRTRCVMSPVWVMKGGYVAIAFPPISLSTAIRRDAWRAPAEPIAPSLITLTPAFQSERDRKYL
jgi:hypothetical protein